MEDKKKVGRRGFLGLVGAAPFAAKEMVAAEASGVMVTGPDANPIRAMGLSRRSKTRELLTKLIQTGDLPAFKVRDFWSRAVREARTLDPDLALMRSIPLSQKVRMQAERNYVRIVREYGEQWEHDTLWEAFKVKALGREPTNDDEDMWD